MPWPSRLLSIVLYAAGIVETARAHLQKAVALAPESESGHQRAATAVATAVRARSGASASSHSSTGCPGLPGLPAPAPLCKLTTLA